MTRFVDVEAIVVDIEGTTSKSSHVFDVLFPYARTRLASWVAQHPGKHLEDLRSQTASLLGLDSMSDEEFIAALEKWSDDDVKASPLKTLQGEIWAAGFAAGELSSHLFDDVAPALASWHEAGKRLFVYSSGSVTAQKSWFSNTAAGNLTPLLEGYFDTVNAGQKREADSYRKIADALNIAPAHILFLTDVPEEVDAALAAGWQVAGLARTGEPHTARLEARHNPVTSFREIEL
jgi:enolase-phosphatase E1